MTNKKNIHVRIEAGLKKESEEILNKIGLNISDAVRIFLQQVVNDKALPFRPKIDRNDNS